MSAGWPPLVTVSVAEALASTAKRAERDRQLAASCGMDAGETEAFLRRLAEFDARTPAWEARCALEDAVDYAEQRRAVLDRVAGWEDSREGMLVRVDAVIAELLEQLGVPVLSLRRTDDRAA